MDTVMQFHGHWLGEMEQLASTAPRKGVANQNTNPNPNNKQEPQVKGLQANQPNDAASTAQAEKARKASVPCRFFGKKDSGCSKGKNCVFKHDWSGIPEKPPGASHAPVWVTFPRIAQTTEECKHARWYFRNQRRRHQAQELLNPPLWSRLRPHVRSQDPHEGLRG